MPTVVDLFSGCGGMSMGFRMAGWQPVCAVDADEDAVATYHRNFPKAEAIRADVTDGRLQAHLRKAYTGVDAVVGGPPCQGFSLIANRNRDANALRYESLNTLPMKFARLAVSLRPGVIVMEEVPTARDTVEQVERYLRSNGFDVLTQVYNAANHGVPQSRKRMILVATAPGARFSPPAPERSISSGEALRRHPRPAQGTLVSDETKRRIHFVKRTGSKLWGKYEVMDMAKPSPTITTNTNSSVGPYAIPRGKEFYNLHVEESARLQSFPPSFEFVGTTTSVRRQIGNAVPPMLARAIAKGIKPQR